MRDGFLLAAGSSMSLKTFSRSAHANKKISVSRTSLKPLLGIPSTCTLCPAGCGIIAYLNGDRLVQILGNPDHPNNKGGICARGISGINLVNDPERILYPLKRIGPRGQNHWSQITWDEAYLTLASRINHLIKEGRIKEFIVDIGQKDPVLLEFIKALGGASVINRPALKDLNRSSALSTMSGHLSFIPDVANSHTILNFGANLFANHDYFVGIARRLTFARIERGTKLITFDVRMSETAAKSDEWYPVKPGTDGSVALAMANIIMNKGLANTEFLKQKTNIPIGMLKEHLSRFPPEWAEKMSGIAAKDIERLASRFASYKPSVAILGGGAYDHENGNQNVRCISLLNWLVGNLEEEGGLFFPLLKPEISSGLSSLRSVSELEREKISADTYFAYHANPSYADAECDESTRLLRDEKTTAFLVVMDTHMTETAMLADMVLPSATYLEAWGVEPAPSLDGIAILNLRQPVVSLLSPAKALRSPMFDAGKLMENTFQPLGEAKEVGNFCLKLAGKIKGDFETKLPYKDTRDYTSKKAFSFLNKNSGLQALKEKGFWIRKETFLAENNTSKINLQPPLPGYIPIRSHEKKNPDQFVLTTFKNNLGTKGTENSKWAKEIFHENRLWLNKHKAEQLGIENGEKVVVTSSVGSLTVRILTTNLIHPESVALAEGLGHTAFGSLARARKARSKDRDTQHIWWSQKGEGVNPFSIIENRVDPVGGGHASKDTLVRVQKIKE